MRCKTKSELVILADLLVEKYDIENVMNCNEFLEYALHEATNNYIALNKQTLVKYESDLKRMCRAKILEAKNVDDVSSIENDNQVDYAGLIEDKFDEFLESYSPKKLVMTINFYDDGTYEKVKPQSVKEVPSVFAPPKVKIPEYTMFAEAEDGLMVIKGTKKGRLIHEIDIHDWPGAARGWAKWCLQQDKNLTDDDRDVFNKIIEGKI